MCAASKQEQKCCLNAKCVREFDLKQLYPKFVFLIFINKNKTAAVRECQNLPFTYKAL